MKVFTPDTLKGIDITLEHVWQRLGYTNSLQAPTQIQRAFMQAVEIGRKLLKPSGCYDIFPIQKLTSSSVVLRGISFKSRELVARCRGAKEIAVFIATIGIQLEERVKQLFRLNPTLAFILDSYGSEAVVALVCLIREVIRKYASLKGYRVGERYCPGYGDWDIKEQQKLFSLLNGGQVGVRLGASFMMTPRKSYAGILPLGPDVLDIKINEECYKD